MPDLTVYDYDIFLSHNHADQEWTAKLAERLESEEWHGRKLKVFFSPWDIRPGQSIPKEIETALPKSRKVGLILSPEAVSSAWVELERLVTTYIAVSAREERLIPLLRRDCEIPPLLRPILGVDFRDDAKFESEYLRLLAVIREEPLLRRSTRVVEGSAVSHALIPRPPAVGFVSRRDSDGRDIVERLKEELDPIKNQLVVLSGAGGVGKTTIAAEVARALVGSLANRLVWINALGREDFALSTLLDEIATQLGETSLRTLAPEAKAQAVQTLIASGPALIVLDNFETIKDAEEQTRCVAYLLHRASCPALITTRQKIATARNITIPTMSHEEADAFLQRVIDQSTDPSSLAQLDRARIMQASDRNPLVMQWVMGQIELAQEAESVLDELAQGVGDAAQRVFDRSFELQQLGEDGRAALLALSLFAPDASRKVLAYVAGFGEDLKRLNEATKRLAALSLVRPLAGGQRLTVAGLTRELAKARLRKIDPSSEFGKRFVLYFRKYVEAHATPTPEDYAELEAERDNVLAAIDIAFELKDFVTVFSIVDTLVAPYSGVLVIRGYWDEALKRGHQALECARQVGNEWNIASIAGNMATVLQFRGEYDKALRLHEQTLVAFRRLKSEENIAVALHQLAMITLDQGEPEEAKRLYDESLAIKTKLGDEAGIAITLHQLAILAQSQGEVDEARELYTRSLELKRKLGNEDGIANTLHQLGILAQEQGNSEEAHKLYKESLAIKERLGHQAGIAISTHQLAQLELNEGDFDEARRLFHASLEIHRRLGNQDGISGALHELSRLALRQGDLVESRRLAEESLEIKKRLGNQHGISTGLYQLATLAQTRGEFSEARLLYNQSLEIKKKLGNQNGIGITLQGLAGLAEEEGQNEEAAQLLTEALEIFEKVKSPNADLARQSLERVKGKFS